MKATNIYTTLGAMEIGVIISIFLFGALTIQVYIYFHKFTSDSWKFKLLVSNGIDISALSSVG
jgi:hypothetical protein